MQFLIVADILGTDGKKPHDFEALLKEEVKGTVEGYLDGTLRQVWLQGSGDGAVALMEAASAADAEAIIAKWPLAKAGLLDARLIALKPFSGFGPA